MSAVVSGDNNVYFQLLPCSRCVGEMFGFECYADNNVSGVRKSFSGAATFITNCFQVRRVGENKGDRFVTIIAHSWILDHQ